MDSLDVRQLRAKYVASTHRLRKIGSLSRDEHDGTVLEQGSVTHEMEFVTDSDNEAPDDIDDTGDLEQLDEIAHLSALSSTPHLDDDLVFEHCFWIESGVLAEERIQKAPDISDEFTLALHQIAIKGIQSFELLVRSNLRLVLSIARRSSARIPLSDRFQAGCEGLMRAIEKFDFRLGYKFSTYATHWIRQSITREVYNSGTIVRTPVHLDEKLIWDKDNRVMRFRSDVNFSQLERIWILSLYEPLDVDNFDIETETIWTSLVPPAKDSDWIAEIHRSDLLNVIQSILLFAGVDERALEILQKRFGFEAEPQTLDEIGKSFGVTRERIRQIEKKAMESLREYSFMLLDLEIVFNHKELSVP